jgi:hypothetical protein
MVFRQVLCGIGGGAALAVAALFISTPRVVIEEKGGGLLASMTALFPVANGAAHKVSSTDVLPEEEESPSRTGALVASLGEVAVPHDTEMTGGELPVDLLEEQATPDLPPSAEDLVPDLYVGALSKQTIIRSRPDLGAPIIGFARTGALLRRAAIPTHHKGCKEGWYRVEPDGYVCVGQTATTDPNHPIIRLASLQPDRSLGLPYPYGVSRYPTPPLYTRIPTQEEQQIAEQDLHSHLKKNFGAVWEKHAATPPPELLAQGEMIPRPYGYPILERDFMTGRALASSAFSFIDLFEANGRYFGLTADLSLLPLDRLTPVSASEFSGVTLNAEKKLPLAFVRSRSQLLYEGDPENGSLRPLRPIGFREALHLTGKEVTLYGEKYLETVDGKYLKDHPLVVKVKEREKLPKWAKDDRSWIDVAILDQTLVAYRGDTPIFATLVSTGKDGLGDPEKSHSTARGVFLIHTKHVTSTMSGDEADDEFDLRDVPYVQYFHGGYAFHAAFWHDGFGAPRSHGCVNLSPADARHLFSLTDPPVPLRWHSALSTKGTLVSIHP